jgi:hypothetical protein
MPVQTIMGVGDFVFGELKIIIKSRIVKLAFIITLTSDFK